MLELFSLVGNMTLTEKVLLSMFVFATAKSQEHFLYKDPLGLMVNYTGETENGNVPHGFGMGIFLDESDPYSYYGLWRHGLATGFGQIIYANGDVYIGETRNRIRTGFGKYMTITGDSFVGEWKNGRKSGFGFTKSWLGHSFIGANLNDNLEGFGIFTVAEGIQYEGKYSNNQPIGVHDVTFANGTHAKAKGMRDKNGLTWTIQAPEIY